VSVPAAEPVETSVVHVELEAAAPKAAPSKFSQNNSEASAQVATSVPPPFPPLPAR